MKKALLFTVAIATICCFTACGDKEGVYNPKKKISTISESSYSINSNRDYDGTWMSDTSSEDKHLAEQWTWDGDLLTKITHYTSWYTYDDQGNLVYKTDEYTTNMTYDGKQLVKVEEDGLIMTFTYDGKKLASATVTEDAETVGNITFEYDGKKISKMNVTNYDYDDWKSAKPSKMERLLTDLLLPDVEVSHRFAKDILKSKATKDSQTMSLNLTWDGDNITKIETSMDGIKYTMTYTYDNKNNPHDGSLYAMLFDSELEEIGIYSENNIINAKYTYGMGIYSESEEVNYTYTYDGNWPVTRTSLYSQQEDEWRYEHGETKYFEYK